MTGNQMSVNTIGETHGPFKINPITDFGFSKSGGSEGFGRNIDFETPII